MVSWPVEVRRPGLAPQTFTARFKAVSRARFAELADGVPADQVEAVFLREAVVGWRDICRPDGSPLRFSAGAREHMIADPAVRSGLMLAFRDLVRHVASGPTSGGGLSLAA